MLRGFVLFIRCLQYSIDLIRFHVKSLGVGDALKFHLLKSYYSMPPRLTQRSLRLKRRKPSKLFLPQYEPNKFSFPKALRQVPGLQ